MAIIKNNLLGLDIKKGKRMLTEPSNSDKSMLNLESKLR